MLVDNELMQMNKPALVCFSGGQDSTTCLYLAKKNFSYVEAVIFRYGQRHENEVAIAVQLAAEAGVPYFILDIPLSHLSSNALTDLLMAMDEEKPADSFPNTFVPGRNMLFLTYAAILARSHGIYDLVIGVSEADYSGYPDCREAFIRSLNETLNLAMDEYFVIHTPLINSNKREIWALADELGIFELVRTRTLTCYNGILADGCGHCPACQLRQAGLSKYLS